MPSSVVSPPSVSVQVDASGSGRVAASEAALFLKRSGLSDLILGKVKSITVHVYNYFKRMWDVKINILMKMLPGLFVVALV